MGLFDSDAFMTPFEETVVFTASSDESAAVRRSTVRASVHQGESLASDSGARIHSETGADWSLVIRRSAWPWPFPPAFGMTVKARGKRLAVKSCDEDEVAFTVRCTADERAGAVD